MLDQRKLKGENVFDLCRRLFSEDVFFQVVSLHTVSEWLSGLLGTPECVPPRYLTPGLHRDTPVAITSCFLSFTL